MFLYLDFLKTLKLYSVKTKLVDATYFVSIFFQ